MSEIKIKCPTCGKILRLQDSPTINNAKFTCPACEEKHVVGKCKRYIAKPKPQSAGEETQYGIANKSHTSRGEETQYSATSSLRTSIGEETQYAGSCGSSTGGDETQINFVPQAKVGTLVDSCGRTYQLRVGVNSVGRRATTSPATVQINTNDRTMSRNHAIIEARNAGGQMIHILKNGANKNPSYHNGALIGPSDQMILNNGDTIKCGNTVLTFKK